MENITIKQRGDYYILIDADGDEIEGRFDTYELAQDHIEEL